MSVLKTGFIAASFCLVASFAHADASVPVQGLTTWNAAKDAKTAYASAQPRMAKTWTNNAKAAPFSREAMEEKGGY